MGDLHAIPKVNQQSKKVCPHDSSWCKGKLPKCDCTRRTWWCTTLLLGIVFSSKAEEVPTDVRGIQGPVDLLYVRPKLTCRHRVEAQHSSQKSIILFASTALVRQTSKKLTMSIPFVTAVSKLKKRAWPLLAADWNQETKSKRLRLDLSKDDSWNYFMDLLLVFSLCRHSKNIRPLAR